MVKLLVDSGSDFTNEQLNDRVDFLPFYVNFSDTTYISDLRWNQVSETELYDYIHQGNLPQISQPPVKLWSDQIEEYLKQGYDILYLSMSKELSGGYKCFNIAKNLLKEKYTNRMEVINTNTASSAIKIIGKYATDLIMETDDIDYIIEQLDYVIKNVQFYAISKNLKYWLNSGRSDQKQFPEGVPLMHQENGQMKMIGLFKTKEEAIEQLSKIINDTAMTVCIDTTIDIDKKEVDLLKEKCKIFDTNNLISGFTSPTITCVGGPESITLSYL